ncbi:MAG: hypothetical protein ACYTGZ_16230 [Planctomycetota bacterium]|jgi:hypothetical protein
MKWWFTPNEKRLSITLPKAFGGATHDVCMVGNYTFQPVAVAAA